MKKVKSIALLLLGVISGAGGRRFLLRLLFRADVSNGATVGICWIDCDKLVLEEGARIGHFSVIRNLEYFHLERYARVGTFNWIFGARGTDSFASFPKRVSSFLARTGASLTSRHIVDCTDSVTIGKFATVAGYRSQILTHAIDLRLNQQACAPVDIGEFAFIGSGSILLKGSKFPPRSVLGAGSVYSGSTEHVGCIWAGNPASMLKAIDSSVGYFARQESHVS